MVPKIPIGHVHPEHRAPVPGGQQAAQQQADQLPGDRGDLVDAQPHAALPAGNASVRMAPRWPSASPRRTPARSASRSARARPSAVSGSRESAIEAAVEDDEAEVVDPHPAVDVAELPSVDHQDASPAVPDDHPEQVADVARGDRVQVDAAEDGGHRDDHDSTRRSRIVMPTWCSTALPICTVTGAAVAAGLAVAASPVPARLPGTAALHASRRNRRTSIDTTADQLLDGNYLTASLIR